MNEDTKALYMGFVTRSFRDIADKDYLAARILYKVELGPQFLWSAHQAIEKYLKAIILYNDLSTKKIGHNLEKAFKQLDTIKEITFDFPNDIEDFIKYLNQQGNNRYFEKPAYAVGEELLMLDRTVWFIRRYYFIRLCR